MSGIHGRSVVIKNNVGMPEFRGKSGVVWGREGKLYRIHLDEPVHVEGVGRVTDDLWERGYFNVRPEKKLRLPKKNG